MRLKKLRWKNFMSYGKEWSEIDLDRNELVNIIGENGRGKSVFLDVLHFALTNRPFRKVKMGEIPNTINKKNCLVELEVERGDTRVLVRRGTNPKVFELYLNGADKPLDQESRAEDHQKVLERLIGFNSKTLRYTIIMSSMNYSPFLKMSAAEKRLFIDDILSVGIFTELGSFVKQKFGLLKTKITDVEYSIKGLESNLDLIREMNSKVVHNSEEQIKLLKEKVSSLKSSITELDSVKIDTIGRLNEASAKLKELETELESKTSRVQELAKERSEKILKKIKSEKTNIEREFRDKMAVETRDHDHKLDQHEKKLAGLKEKLAKMKSAHASMVAECNEMDRRNTAEMRSIDDDAVALDKRHEFLDTHSECPTCEGVIDDKFKARATAKLDKKADAIDGRRESLESAEGELKAKKEKAEKFKERISEYEAKCGEFVDKISAVKLKFSERMSVVKQEMSKRIAESRDDHNVNLMKISEKSGEKITEIKDRYAVEISDLRETKSSMRAKSTADRQSIADKKAMLQDYESQIERLENPEVAEVKDETEVLGELNDNRKELEALNERRRVFEMSIKLLSDKGFKTFVVNKYIPVLNKYVNQYLDLLEAHYRLKFDAELNEQIVARGYERLSYDALSSGEKARCDLALLFAFLELSKKKNSVDSNLLVLDEVADNSLDKNGVHGVLNIISRLKNMGYTVYAISHRDEIKDHFDVTLEATKTLFSSLKEV